MGISAIYRNFSISVALKAGPKVTELREDLGGSPDKATEIRTTMRGYK